MDLVGTCPAHFWTEWLEEGDCAGDPYTGDSYIWHSRAGLASLLHPGDRFYVVARGRLRGYAPVVQVLPYKDWDGRTGYEIYRRGGAVAVTIPQPIRGFQGLRKRWWPRSAEVPFPDWRTP